MTRRLVLIRHAKAGVGPIDHERALADRGRKQAPGIGRWLADHAIQPDRVVVSTARRTRETWALAAGELPAPPLPEFDERIYENYDEVLFEIVRETAPDVETLILVGHNPSMPGFAVNLDWDSTASAAGRRLNTSFPTSAIAVVEVDRAWEDVAPGGGVITAMATPADFRVV